jgi:hypothetical protein
MPQTGETEPQRGLAHERLREVRERLLRIVEPVKREVAEIDARLEVIEAERADLLTARREAMNVIRVADPAEREKAKPKAKAHTNGSSYVSDDVRATIVGLVREHADEFADGFNVGALDRHPEMRLNKSTLARALPLLADEGVLRLDRVGKLVGHPMGRASKIYKLTEGAE